MQNKSHSQTQQQKLPNQRWLIHPEQPEITKKLAKTLEISPLIAQSLINRDLSTIEQAQAFLDPESIKLPSPIQEFPDLEIALNLLQTTISQNQKIAICGDYDADGMTSTALLLRTCKHLGAKVDYAIPSRMQEGYGINERIVEEFHQEGVSLILTVDNGIAAYQPIAKARELGLNVIITDHHDIPPNLPPANAILNPKLISETSPYRSVAGVGVAYILALCLAKRLDKLPGLSNPLLELFTLGTIADLAPLTGVNRRWVKRGLQLLPRSQLAGVRALIQVSNVKAQEQGNLKQTNNQKSLKPDDIGFRLGPRINAVGRIADPQIVIELLTTDDKEVAEARAKQCQEINQTRQELCAEIEQEAIAWCEESQINLQEERVLVVVQPGWHHGVIGIVASRLVERYGVPVFIGSYEEEQEQDTDLATAHTDLATAHTDLATDTRMDAGMDARMMFPHSASTTPTSTIREEQEQDTDLATAHTDLATDARMDAGMDAGMTPAHPTSTTPTSTIREEQEQDTDLATAHTDLATAHTDLATDTRMMLASTIRGSARGIPEFHVFEALQFCDNLLGKYGGHKAAGGFSLLGENLDKFRSRLSEFAHQCLEIHHLKPLVTIDAEADFKELNFDLYHQIDLLHPCGIENKSPIFWTPNVRVAEQRIVGAGHIKLTLIKSEIIKAIAWRWGDYFPLPQLVDIAYKLRENTFNGQTSIELELVGVRLPTKVSANQNSSNLPQKAEFYYSDRLYTCSLYQIGDKPELRIRNSRGEVLAIQQGKRIGLLGKSRNNAREVDVSQPRFFNLIKAAMNALKLRE
ncbi:DHH family phosphoesterase [Okeania sp. SIO3I5]|uniref:single-stranded-DNA-specific exonuclease RecJ n=1 Tax=Okeania sp. SIO3I5 TaxID=2607805 RepID=UPI0026012E54|nr:DHH family phosphoesterase [Okeania sp. SIO3I5]